VLTWLSGAGAFAGALAVARLVPLSGSRFWLCVVWGLLLALAAILVTQGAGAALFRSDPSTFGVLLAYLAAVVWIGIAGGGAVVLTRLLVAPPGR